MMFCGCSEVEKPAPPQAAAQQPSTPVVTPKLSVNAMMVGLVDHASHVIWNAADPKKPPKSDADWHELEYHSMQLAAAGTVIKLGGTGKADPGWAQQTSWGKYADGLSDAGLAALDAARLKNREGIAKAGDQLVETCENCHKEFKPDAPTEGILHPHE
jgi:hypothetical protein